LNKNLQRQAVMTAQKNGLVMRTDKIKP